MADGLRDKPDGVIVVRPPPFSTDTNGLLEVADTADMVFEDSVVVDVGNATGL